VEAAFFDLDKTVIAKSSVMAFARPLRQGGLLGRRSYLRGAWTQIWYVHFGADAKRMERIRSSVLAITTGWPQAQVRQIVADHLATAIDPITHPAALALIRDHQREGRRVYLVSSSPEEMVEAIGARLGVDGVIATSARLDDSGCYAGELERYAYGPAKATIISELAAREGIDLGRSWAYSDSITDTPMLEVVGHPVAVNPDRPLRRLAIRNDWPVIQFSAAGRGGTPAGSDQGRPAGPESPAVRGAAPGRSSRRRVGVLASAAAALTTFGGATAWWWRRRGQLQPHRA
jgi:HAD superfamily hydrolase (TIGR01490 family)